jgi:rare lipoprotein A
MRLILAALALVAGVTIAHAESGIASVYGTPQDRECGRPVAWAKAHVLDCKALVAAHRTLPFGTMVKVTNAHTGKSIAVQIVDRGPYIAGRIIDLTPAAAAAIACPGLCAVVVEVITGYVPTSNDLFRGAQ